MNFENRFIYRLIQVIYYFTLIIGLFIAGICLFDGGEVSDVFLGTIIHYSVVNIIRETLMYLAFGKKLTWNWMLHPLKFLITFQRKA